MMLGLCVWYILLVSMLKMICEPIWINLGSHICTSLWTQIQKDILYNCISCWLNKEPHVDMLKYTINVNILFTGMSFFSSFVLYDPAVGLASLHVSASIQRVADTILTFAQN